MSFQEESKTGLKALYNGTFEEGDDDDEESYEENEEDEEESGRCTPFPTTVVSLDASSLRRRRR